MRSRICLAERPPGHPLDDLGRARGSSCSSTTPGSRAGSRAGACRPTTPACAARSRRAGCAATWFARARGPCSSGIPLVWLSRFRRRIRRPWRMRPGRSLLTRSSSRSLPSATSCITTVATKLFVMLPAQNRSSGRAFRSPISASPAATTVRCAVLLDERDHGGDVARRDQAVGGPLELGLGRGSGAAENGHPDDERSDQQHAPRTRRGRRELHAVTPRAFAVYEGHRWPPISPSSSRCHSLRVSEPEFLARAERGDHEAYASPRPPVRAGRVPRRRRDHRRRARTRRRRCRTASSRRTARCTASAPAPRSGRGSSGSSSTRRTTSAAPSGAT